MVAALREYASREPVNVDGVVFYGMLFLGGRYPTEGKVAAPPPGARDKRTVGQVWGHHTLDQLIDRLGVLVDRHGVNELFLMPAFVRAIEDKFERAAANVVPGAERSRQDAGFFESLAADPVALREWNGSPRHVGDDLTAGEALVMAEHMRELGKPSLGKIKDRQDALDSWRAVTGPVADRDYLDGRLHDLAMRDYDRLAGA